MNTKHTPGPWKHSSFQVWAQGAAGNTFGTLVASLRRADATDAVAEADARLIVAAPELLTSVRALLDIIHDDLTHARQEDHREALEAAKNAIAKATKQ